MITKNKISYGYTVNNKIKQIVFHQCYSLESHILNNIYNSILFFDDALYSQYCFIIKNEKIIKQNGNICVIGVSPALIRINEKNPIYHIKSNIIHEYINLNNNLNNNVLNGIMSKKEILNLLYKDYIYIALHGNKHLDLRKKQNRFQLFKEEIKNGLKILNNIFNIQTNIFVYPYNFEFPGANKILLDFNFTYIYGGYKHKRIEIEDYLKCL